VDRKSFSAHQSMAESNFDSPDEVDMETAQTLSIVRAFEPDIFAFCLLPEFPE
jgi:hypothetical protein